MFSIMGTFNSGNISYVRHFFKVDLLLIISQGWTWMGWLSASVIKSGLKDGMKWKVVIKNEPRSWVRLLYPAPPFLLKHGGRQNFEGPRPGTGKPKLTTVERLRYFRGDGDGIESTWSPSVLMSALSHLSIAALKREPLVPYFQSSLVGLSRISSLHLFVYISSPLT